MFTSSTKRDINYFHVVVVQWRQRNIQKGVMHVQSWNLLLFCRSRWCRCWSRCLSFLIMTDGTSRNAVVRLTKFLTGLPQSVHEERSDCICHYLYCTSRRSKGSGKYRGKPVERGTSTPAFCVLTRTIFFLSPSPLKPLQRRPIDLNSLHVLFSQWRSCLFIDCARG